ncbi:hypothetical protein BLNAU_7196 [Blattamonas nauphoetae]|uniref:Uncharacterized protein n=1 Tax=Blattamonas nauphoetae TaxID=2049346 RepID=A0ABQ9Y1Y7_9EUKA|nr:hypothetical protein BLNAU_7196 [Blattamonas nauphoetae]
MTPTHFCGLSSDVGNALIAGADDQILGSPPIVQKCHPRSHICGSEIFELKSEISLVHFKKGSGFTCFVVCCRKEDKLDFPDSLSSVHTLQEPFLNFDPNSELSFDEKSAIYCSLVALVRAEHPFDDVLLDRAARFLKNISPKSDEPHLAAKLFTDLVPSSDGLPSGFINSVVFLLSSTHSTVATSALSFLDTISLASSPAIQFRLVESDLVTKLLTSVQPHTLPISGNEEIFGELLRIIDRFVDLASAYSLSERGITDAVEKYNHHEMIFQKVVLPSSQFVTFLITNRYNLNEDLFRSFIDPVSTLLQLGPFHRPTLEFVVASPIVMAFSSCLSFVEGDFDLWVLFGNLNYSLKEWKKEGSEVTQSGKRMIQVLYSEGFEDTLEQTLLHKKSGYNSFRLVDECQSIWHLLGSNVKRLQ